MEHQSYVLLCSKIISFPPSEGVGEITFGSIQSRPPCSSILNRKNFLLPHFFLSHLVICDPPCQNGGVCRKSGRCKCLTGYKGAQCQMERRGKKRKRKLQTKLQTKQYYYQKKATMYYEETNILQICLLFFLYSTRSQYYILRKIHIWRNDSATTVQFKQPLLYSVLLIQ